MAYPWPRPQKRLGAVIQRFYFVRIPDRIAVPSVGCSVGR